MPTSPRCEVRTEDEPDGAVVVVEGEVDIDAVGLLLDVIGTAGRDGRPVVIDMSGTTFIDSTGVFALVRSHEACEAAGGTMTVRSPSASVRRVFELTHLDRMFAIDPAS